ncbi:tRNA lysidine(34) synthetase TilS [Sulfurimonas sp.]|uniref:tRNA lysidine(34) synthetase TilS n=1 Tax=Sulfurimonas sp. TaxID=2022749 RepID=UPI003567C875
MLKNNTLDFLSSSKNLLAFSAGVDSTALFFLLKESKIKFDIAIVDYGLREQSKEELSYAKELSEKHNLKCFVKTSEKIDSNFEANARAIRYDFFENIIKEHGYDNLLTAHHLGDRFEWFMMQFCKGAGCVELSGMKTVDKKDNYSIIRPLLHLDKSELLKYLKTKQIKYYEDQSNFDKSYTRNRFRHEFTNPLISEYLDGIKKSFEYIDSDVDALIEQIEVNVKDDFACFVSSKNKRSDIYTIDKYLKSIGYMMSANERELLKTSESLVVGRKYIISIYKEYIFIAPYINEEISMNKEFKDKMRKLNIDPKLRLYFYTHSDIFESLELA